VPGAVESQRYTGREGIDANIAETPAIWQQYSVVPEEYRDLGEQVLVLSHVLARRALSGVPVDQAISQVFDFRCGKISRLRTFLDRSEALKAVGLAE
jgi:ketosteroid isomerase-like protein